jgi:hypothetical protein
MRFLLYLYREWSLPDSRDFISQLKELEKLGLIWCNGYRAYITIKGKEVAEREIALKALAK